MIFPNFLHHCRPETPIRSVSATPRPRRGWVLASAVVLGLLTACSTTRSLIGVGEGVLSDLGSAVPGVPAPDNKPITEWDVFLKPTPPMRVRHLLTERAPSGAIVVGIVPQDRGEELLRELFLGLQGSSDGEGTENPGAKRARAREQALRFYRQFQMDVARIALRYSDVIALHATGDLEAVRDLTELRAGLPHPRGALMLVECPVQTLWTRDYAPVWAEQYPGQYVALDAMYRDVRTEPGESGRRSRDDAAAVYLVQALRARSESWVPLVRPPLQLWGGDLFTDGRGTVFLSTETLIMNGGLQQQFEQYLAAYYAARRVVYLEPLPGPTIKHADMFLKILGPDLVLLAEYAPHHLSATAYGTHLEGQIRHALADNERRLRAALPKARIVRVPMPSPLPDMPAASLSLTDFLLTRQFEVFWGDPLWEKVASEADALAVARYLDSAADSPQELDAKRRLWQAGANCWRERCYPEGYDQMPDFDRFVWFLDGQPPPRPAPASSEKVQQMAVKRVDFPDLLRRAEPEDSEAVRDYQKAEAGSEEETAAAVRVLSAAARAWSKNEGKQSGSDPELVASFCEAVYQIDFRELTAAAQEGEVAWQQRLMRRMLGTRWGRLAALLDEKAAEDYQDSDPGSPEEILAIRRLLEAGAKSWRSMADLPAERPGDAEVLQHFAAFLGAPRIPADVESLYSDHLEKARLEIPSALTYRTYLNSLLINDRSGTRAVLVPRYSPRGGETADYIRNLEDEVMAAYQRALPGVQVEWIECSRIIESYGAVHCTTSSVPAF